MFYRIFLFIGFNILISQSFFNNTIGDETGFQSARSYAIGQTHFMNSNTSVITLRNPARLSFIENSGEHKIFGLNFQVDFSSLGNLNSERRSIDLKDFFGDFLTEADYVSNNNFYIYNQFGFIGSFNLFSLNAAIGFSHGPWSSLNYNYNEEVRGSQSFDDGIIGIRDPIVGYHILSHDGEIDLSSAGLSIGLSEFISLGLSYNHLHDGSYGYRFLANQLSDSNENLASVLNKSEDIRFNGDSFISISTLFSLLNNIQFSLGYEGDALILSDNIASLNILDALGLPSYIDYSNVSSLEYSSDGLFLQKPEKIKFGFSYIQGIRNSRLFSFELIQNNFNNNQAIKDYLKINMGIEYTNYDTVFRFGLSYKEPSFQALSPLTTLCFGTAKQYNNIVFDIGASYSYQAYNYIDVFPVDGDVRPDYDNVHESNWDIISTISYNF